MPNGTALRAICHSWGGFHVSFPPYFPYYNKEASSVNWGWGGEGISVKKHINWMLTPAFFMHDGLINQLQCVATNLGKYLFVAGGKK